MRMTLLTTLGTAVLAAAAVPASAAPNLITNGNFTLVSAGSILDNGGGTGGGPTSNAKSGELTTGDVYGWSTANSNPAGRGPLLLYTPGTADSTGTSNGTGGNGNVVLYGPGGGVGASNYSNNGFTYDTLPGAGGNFIAADADPVYNDAITQTVTGLTVGTNYLLSFDYAGAQENGNCCATTETWQVTFGSSNYTTPTINTPAQGFAPWRTVSTVFTATGTSEVLSFLAVGGPTGAPPFSLLDNVQLSAVPEPTTWAVTFLGGIGLLMVLRRRNARSVAGAAA